MTATSDSPSQQTVLDEGEIFKSLSHEIRRNIIKRLGAKQSLSFSELNAAIGLVDTPTLAYHLKSLKFLVDQKATQYSLTEIGQAALLLMDRIDQSNRFKSIKRKFRVANILTIVCWAIIGIVIPFIVAPYVPDSIRITVVVLLNIFTQINSIMIWFLWGYSTKSITTTNNAPEPITPR
jgi:DNA-binding transcriptional ArsR family regulator